MDRKKRYAARVPLFSIENMVKNPRNQRILRASRGGRKFPELITVCFFFLHRLGGPHRVYFSLYGRRGRFSKRVFLPGGEFFPGFRNLSTMRGSGEGPEERRRKVRRLQKSAEAYGVQC